MPIRPERAKLYPGGGIRSKEWRAFRAELLARAENRCEGTPQNPDCRAEDGLPHPITGSKVKLTIAHMDHDERHADPDRCRALCNRCHNQWDAPHRKANARIKNRRKYAQLDLEDYLQAIEPAGEPIHIHRIVEEETHVAERGQQ